MATQTTPAVQELLKVIEDADTTLEIALQYFDTMSVIDKEMQATVIQCTLNFRSYKKRVAKADAFFAPMKWDDIASFVQDHLQECINNRWNYVCMLQHLTKTFPDLFAQLKDWRMELQDSSESCFFGADGTWLMIVIQAVEAKKLLEDDVLDDDVEMYSDELTNGIALFMEKLKHIRSVMTQLSDGAVEVVVGLENARTQYCCDEARKVCLLVFWCPLRKLTAQQCGPRCGV